MADSDLKVQVVIDTSQIGTATNQVSASVQAMADRIGTAFGSLAKAPEGVQRAFEQMATAGSERGAAFILAVRDIESSLQSAGAEAQNFGSQSEQGMERAGRSFNNARSAFAGLTREIGIGGNRALGSFLAQSETIAPLLNSAFGAIAIVGFIEIVSQIPAKITEVTDALVGWDKAAKEAYASSIAASKEQLAFVTRIQIEQLKINEVGLSGSAKLQQEQKNLNSEVSIWNQRLTEAQHTVTSLNEQLNATTTIQEHIGRTVTQDVQVRAIRQGSKEWDELTKKISAAQHEADEYMDKIREINEVKKPEVKAETGDAQAKEASEALKATAREGVEATKEQAREELEQIDRVLQAQKEARREEIELSKEAATEELRQLKEAEEAKTAEFREEVRLSKENALEELRNIKLVDEAKKKAAADAAKEARETLEKEQQALEQITNGPLKQFVSGFLIGTQSMERTFEKFGASLLTNTIDTLAKAGVHWAEYHVLQEVLQSSSIARQIAAFISGEGTKRAIQSASNVAQVQSSAGVGGAAAFASVLEALPFPFNVAVAPGVAAGEIAQIESIGSIAAFEKGGLVPGDMLAMLHAKEMVLPANIAKKVQDGAGGSSVGGDTHYHFGGISAIDGPSVQRHFDKHADKIVRSINKKTPGRSIIRW